MEKREYCFTCKAVKPHQQGSNKSIWFCTGCHRSIHFCGRCDRTELVTEGEVENGICDGCAIDLYEEQQRNREQAWLEDDRNWV